MTVKKSFSIFVSIVILSIVGVLFLSIDAATFDVLTKADGEYLFYSALLVVMGWSLDGVKFVCLSKAAGESLTMRQTMSVVWINYFGCAITPMQSGGGPFQIYLLYRNGVSVGKSVAITLVRTIQVLFLLAVIVPFALIAEPEFFAKHMVLKWFVGYVIIFISASFFILAVSVVRPQWIKRWSSGTLLRMKNIGVLKPKRLFRAIRWINREIDNYSTNIRLFTSTGRKWFFISLIVAAIHLLVYMSIMPCLIVSMGFHVSYIQCILAESLLLFLLYFVPTPGGSGAAEGGAAAVFALFVPWNLAGVMAVAWRLLSEYTGVALGTVIAIRLLGWCGVDEVMREESVRNEDEHK